MGLNPSWRTALAHVVFGDGWDDGANSTVINQVRDNIRKNTPKVDALTTDSGSYINEVKSHIAIQFR